MTTVLVIDALHLLDAVEPAHDVSRAERLSRLYRTLPDFVDEADVAGPLMAPRFGSIAGIERHPCQPRPVRAGLRIARVIGADHPLRHPVAVAAVVEFSVRRELLRELTRRDLPTITQIDLAEGIATLVLHMPRHVLAEEKRVAGVAAEDAVRREEVTFPSGKDERLLPLGAGLFARRGEGVFPALLDGHEVLPFDHARVEFLGLRANLRAFDAALGRLAMIGIPKVVRQVAG